MSVEAVLSALGCLFSKMPKNELFLLKNFETVKLVHRCFSDLFGSSPQAAKPMAGIPVHLHISNEAIKINGGILM